MWERESLWNKEDLPWITLILAGINVLVFVRLELIGSTMDAEFMYEQGALFVPAVLEEGEYYRLVTAAFLHFGSTHLMNNMLMLLVLGERLEHALGRVRYLTLYLLTAVGANLFSLYRYAVTEPYVVSAGASGALMGVAGGLFGVILRRRRSQEGLNPRDMLILIGLSLYSGYAAGNSNNIAHLSGALLGFLLGLILGW